jgi:hypothetical protein
MKIWDILTKGTLKRDPTQASTTAPAPSACKTSPPAPVPAAPTSPVAGNVVQATPGPTIKPQTGSPTGKEVPLPPRIVTHIAAAVVTAPKDHDEAEWWAKNGSLHLFRSLDPAFVSSLEAQGSKASFQTVLISRAPGPVFQGDQGSIGAVTDLLGKAKDVSTVLYKAGLAKAAFRDGNARDVGFVFAIAFPPPLRVQPWFLMVAANRPFIPCERLVMPRSDGSVAEADAQQLYPPNVPAKTESNSVSEKADLVNRLVPLIVAANSWGAQNGYPLMSEYPQYSEVRGIGERLNEIGGIDLMRQAYSAAQRRLPYPGINEYWWDGVGQWVA